jgi:hypothetical protein
MADHGGLTVTDFGAWDFHWAGNRFPSLAGLDRNLARLAHRVAHSRALGRVWKTWASTGQRSRSPMAANPMHRLQDATPELLKCHNLNGCGGCRSPLRDGLQA